MTVSALTALIVDEALELMPDASEIAVLGSAELATHTATSFPNATVRTADDLTPNTAPSPDGTERMAPEAAVQGATLVLAELPKSNGALDELAQLAASAGSTLVAGGKQKYMTHSQNDVLAQSFTEVSASRGRGKARVLRAKAPRPKSQSQPYPRTARPQGLDFDIVAHGATFAGTKLDIGTRALLDALPNVLEALGETGTALDLGSGTGVLAASLARALPAWTVHATDRSLAAARSTAATAAGAGVTVTTHHADAADALADGSVDLIVLNPPFHEGHAVVDDLAEHLFAASARVLAPGGVLITVYNSHLHHRTALERIVGPTTQLSRSPKFTVTRSARRA